MEQAVRSGLKNLGAPLAEVVAEDPARLEQAKAWAQVAAEDGHAPAALGLFLMSLQHESESRRWADVLDAAARRRQGELAALDSCPRCGGPLPDEQDISSIRVITTRDRAGLVSLLTEGVDAVRCRYGCELPLTPTWVVLDSSAGALVLPGSHPSPYAIAQAFGEAPSSLTPGSQAWQHAVFFGDQAAFRQAVQSMLEERAVLPAAMRDVAGSSQPFSIDLGQRVRHDWRAFSAEWAAAWAVLNEDLAVADAGLSAKVAGDLGGVLQSLTWLVMVTTPPEDWVEVVQAYVADAPQLEGAGQLFADAARLWMELMPAEQQSAARARVGLIAALTGSDALAHETLLDFAVAWLREAVRARGANDRPRPPWVSPELAGQVIDRVTARQALEAMYAVNGPFHAADSLDIRLLLAALSELGYPDLAKRAALLEQVRQARQQMSSGAQRPATQELPDYLTVQLEMQREGASDIAVVDEIARSAAGAYGQAAGYEGYIESWRILYYRLDAAPTARAVSLAETFLAGNPAHPVQKASALHMKARALRLQEEQGEAYRLVMEATAILQDSGFLTPQLDAQLRSFGALLQREMGAPDYALSVLEDLASTPAGTSYDVLEILATTYRVLGRYTDAARCFLTARELYASEEEPTPFSRPDLALAGQAWNAFAAAGRTPPPALTDLLAQSTVSRPEAVLWELDARLRTHRSLPAPAGWTPEARTEYLVGLLPALIEASEQAPFRRRMGYLGLHALAQERRYGVARALAAWEDCAALAREIGGDLRWGDYHLALARNALLDHPPAQAAGHLRKALQDQQGRLAKVDDVAGAAAALNHLSDPVRATLAAALQALPEGASDADFAAVRLCAELSRSVASRTGCMVRMPQKLQTTLNRFGLPNSALAVLAPAEGHLAVLEMMGEPDHLSIVLTTVGPEGDVTARRIRVPEDLGLPDLAERLYYRLRTWRTTRRGSPFDLPSWQRFCDWLHDVLRPSLSTDDHVVVIAHPQLSQLPMHAALYPRYTASYAASWHALLDIATSPGPAIVQHEGAIMVPRIGDPDFVTQALLTYADTASHQAQQAGHTFTLCSGNQADRAALTQLFATTDLVTLLCHGAIDPDGDVLLMLAADGRLPVAHSLAAGSPAAHAHRLSWRELRHIGACPPVVLSAACCSGTTFTLGLGERAGLYSPLRQLGLHTLIAPHWDVDAVHVTAALADVHLLLTQTSPTSKARALRDAYAHLLDRGSPASSVLALALEGDWR